MAHIEQLGNGVSVEQVGVDQERNAVVYRFHFPPMRLHLAGLLPMLTMPVHDEPAHVVVPGWLEVATSTRPLLQLHRMARGKAPTDDDRLCTAMAQRAAQLELARRPPPL